MALTAQQFEKLKAQLAVRKGEPIVQETPSSGSFMSGIKDSAVKRGTGIIDAFKRAAGGQDPLQTAVQTVGQGAGFANDVIGEGVKSAVSALPDAITTPIKKIGVEILQTPAGQAGLKAIQGGVESYSVWKTKNPTLAADLEGVVNIASLLPIGKAGKVTTDAGIDVAKMAGRTAINKADDVVQAVKPAVEFASDVTKEVGTGIVRTVSNVPRRVAANVEASQAQREIIKSLPTKTAKLAAEDGIDSSDIKFIYAIPKEEKKSLKKLFDITEKYANDKTKGNPIQAVGQSVTKRIKELDSVRSSVGQKLGKVADELGTVTQLEVKPVLIEKLQSVPGLKGLQLDKKGKLSFKDTVLSTELTKSDRAAIQKIFNAAIKDGTGKQKHLLRQELFEILGGKKRSLQQLTDTQERAFEAIRDGLSTVLESKNNQYKVLSNSYREAVQPLQEMRKFMKNVAGANEDVLDMQAGLLARRLTSNVQSNPQIRNILQTMDSVLKKNNKKVPISTERLQDFYNILDKYFDIAGGTSFQGQVQRGLEKAGGIREAAAEAVRSFAGRTDDVTKKALKKVIEEALKSGK